MAQNVPYKIYLNESELPKQWYNLRADMKNKPAPLLNPGTGKPMKAEELEQVFCSELVKQELDNDTRFFDIPEEIFNFYKMYRPSPLVRAYFLEEKLGTPAKIYYNDCGLTGQQHERKPQTELRDRAGVLREEAGAQGRDDRDGRRSMGYRPLDGLLVLRPRLQGLSGQGLL